MTCLLFCEHLDTILAEGDFSLDLYIFGILKNYVGSDTILAEGDFSLDLYIFGILKNPIF